MKKIAMLNCLKANSVCTGAGCFRAMNERTGAFTRYKGEEVKLMAFMRCNGCGSDPKTDDGIIEKVERLETIGVESLHIGVCTKKDGKRCETIAGIMEMIAARGIEIVDGTH